MQTSKDLFTRACRRIPGGVNSPVRAFKGVGGEPVFFARGAGAHVWDEDNKRYIDYVGAWGPMILGHSDARVVRAIKDAAERGLGFGAPTRAEVEMAELLSQLMPSLEQVRLVNSGTEATMSAIRLARGFTGRDTIVKFEGCYHGHADSLLVKAGSGALTLGTPTSAGVPADVARHTLVLEYNNLAAVEAAFAQHGDRIAGIIVEPVAGNMGCVPPVAGFLEGLRQVCDQYGAVLIFDEVMTGFRVALGGAQTLYKARPDLTALGKIVGGGLPLSAYGGRADIMQKVAPQGPVYQACTFAGNPIAIAAGRATLEAIQAPNFYPELTAKCRRLTAGLEHAARAAGVALSTHTVGGMFGVFFNSERVERFSQVMASDAERFKKFFHAMLARGVSLAPSAYEAGFVSAAHSAADIDATIAAAAESFKLAVGK